MNVCQYRVNYVKSFLNLSFLVAAVIFYHKFGQQVFHGWSVEAFWDGFLQGDLVFHSSLSQHFPQNCWPIIFDRNLLTQQIKENYTGPQISWRSKFSPYFFAPKLFRFIQSEYSRQNLDCQSLSLN